MASIWAIYRPLREQGFTDYEADKLMEAAMWESISDHPFQYLAGPPTAIRLVLGLPEGME